jgi:hypothetical protein
MTPTARNARLEAQSVVGDESFARVLEPSPPAVTEGPWFADDPVRVASDGRAVVSPVPGPGVDMTWDEWLRSHPDRRGWAADRWLGARRPLVSVPPDLATTRRVLHAVAADVVSPARQAVTGKIGLRWTLGGFGTPFFGDDGSQVRVDARGIVRQVADAVTVEPLDVDADALAWLADWYGFAWTVLEMFRVDGESVGGSRVQLWPEHFDASFECAPATYGFSPGDDDVPEPYVYVSLWEPDRAPRTALWDAPTFPGALLPAGVLTSLGDERAQRAHVLAWLRERRAALASSNTIGL